MSHSKPPVELVMLIALSLLLLCCGVEKVNCSTVHENSKDFHSLLDFKNGITNDPNGALSNWTSNTHFCHWTGVNCTSMPPYRVMELNLTGHGLAGPISPSLRNLTFLVKLDLSNNYFVGSLPAIKDLPKLEILYVNNNRLQGIDPDAVTNCSKLAKLDLNTNFITGAIPPQVGLLPNLLFLDLSQNNLTGTIPQTLKNATNLQGLHLNSNNIDGSIPLGIWQLPILVDLFLGGNRLLGGIPHSLFNLSSIETLSLELNMLGGSLPSNMGDIFPNLSELILNGNEFEGPISISLGNASMLEIIELSNNSFIGQIPVSLGKLSSLYVLSLGGNMLQANDNQSWEFLDALRNCSLLKHLVISNNQLQGVIPPSVGRLTTKLITLQLGWNNISGIVPPSIGNLSGLVQLGLCNNNFSGTIVEWIGNLKHIQGLYLYSNNFNGTIPSSLGSLTQLERLVLKKNNFDGSIPQSLGKLQQLSWLDLRNNNLQGNMPPTLGKLEQLTELRLSSNKLTGEIPDALGQCQQLQIIQMDQNFLVGNIPFSFGKLVALKMLNLSHNNFSGTMPTILEDLHLLNELDLSYNDLQGEIPTNGVFANVTAISLDGNLGLCGGVTGLHMPSCPVTSRRLRSQYFVIRVLIPIFGFMSLILVVYILLLVAKKPRRNYLSLSYIGENFPKVSYQEIAQATGNFSKSNLIGEGSCGTVYRGILKDNKMEVAVKVFHLDMQGAERSFMSECEALRSIQHRNLLPILTVCSTVDNIGNVFKALLYEFMPNGNLDTWLHQKWDGKTSKRLGLTQRVNILVNIADALDYLHHDCGRPTIHCDLKPSNILLDKEMNALLGDFGIASFHVSSQPSSSTGSVSSVGVKGTIGYIAPEYGGGGRHASTSGDVYSFGIILLEMVTGKRPTDPMFKDGLDIVNFVDKNFPSQIALVIDDHLMEECKGFSQANVAPENAFTQCLASLLQIALSCIRPVPSERMNMKEIASKLHEIKTSYLGWKTKG